MSENRPSTETLAPKETVSPREIAMLADTVITTEGEPSTPLFYWANVPFLILLILDSSTDADNFNLDSIIDEDANSYIEDIENYGFDLSAAQISPTHNAVMKESIEPNPLRDESPDPFYFLREPSPWANKPDSMHEGMNKLKWAETETVIALQTKVCNFTREMIHNWRTTQQGLARDKDTLRFFNKFTKTQEEYLQDWKSALRTCYLNMSRNFGNLEGYSDKVKQNWDDYARNMEQEEAEDRERREERERTIDAEDGV